jgi:hypothetical protein
VLSFFQASMGEAVETRIGPELRRMDQRTVDGARRS